MRLTQEQKQQKIEEYIERKSKLGLPWHTLEYDYMLKDLDADIWDANGNELPENLRNYDE